MAKPEKIAVPADLSAPYAVPESVTAADIDLMKSQCHADAEKLLADDNASAEDVAKAEWLIATEAALGVRQTEIAANEQARLDAINATRAKLQPPKTDDDDDDKNPDGTPKDKGDGVEGGAGGDGALAPGQQQAAPPEPVLVASARQSAIMLAKRGGAGVDPAMLPKVETRSAYLTASGSSDHIDFAGLGEIAQRKFDSLPAGQPGGARQIVPIGKVNIPADEQLVASGTGNFADVKTLIEWAVSSDRLSKETGEADLVAAGGWCSPSETLYDLLDLTTTDGLIDLPGITVNRGGVRHTLGPDFTAVYNAGQNFTKTEAQVIAGSAKPIVNIPCPTFADHRMVVDGLYLTGDILSAKGYPEAYADYQQKSLKAFAHYVNAASIADMVALSTHVDLTQPGSSPTWFANKAISTELLGGIELQVTDMRYKNRLSQTEAVELVLPFWLIGAIRSDLAKRQAVENSANISTADIVGYFAQRGASVQWVYDWQDAFTGVSGGFGGATAPTAWPTTVDFLMYPQGTFVRALSDVIELSAVYDAQLLVTNQFVALFMEQSRLTLLRGWDARRVTVPVMVTGATGGPVDYTALQPTV